ncbi:MAG: hypothetical protein IJD90_02880 [Clostridia bacterium]|nr:hypothetical protein [Clostridia bacterium]
MKRIFAVVLCLFVLFSLVSCDEGNNTVEKVKLEVDFTFNLSRSSNSKVCMNTNLPVGTKLDVDIFVGDLYHSKETVEVKADIETNYFITEPQLDTNGETVKDGNYILSVVLVDPAKQSEEVRAVIGQNGEKLSGIYTYETEKGKTVKLLRPIVKKKDFFSMPDN